jgi:transcriptional repressor NrdR
MFCPICNARDTKVVDSRGAQDGSAVRRRRECTKCGYRFSTIEEIELLDLVVVKRDGSRESYSRTKVERGIKESLTKRPVTEERFFKLIHAIERDIQKKRKREITSSAIGDIVIKHLKRFDKVAYIRFASIYRAYENIDMFAREILSLKSKKGGK